MNDLARANATESARAAFGALRTELRWWLGTIAALLIAMNAKLYGIGGASGIEGTSPAPSPQAPAPRHRHRRRQREPAPRAPAWQSVS